MSIKKSGCVHKAHWMVKILYELKIVLFYDEISSLPKSVTTSRRLLELKDNAISIAHVYCDWWPCGVFMCTLPVAMCCGNPLAANAPQSYDTFGGFADCSVVVVASS